MSNEARESVVDNRKYLRQSMLMWDLPPIDIADPESVRERGDRYIKYCMENNLRPGVAGLCLALGINRRTFSGWASGAHRSQTHTQIAQRFKGKTAQKRSEQNCGKCDIVFSWISR